jgi:hypothetical protein
MNLQMPIQPPPLPGSATGVVASVGLTVLAGVVTAAGAVASLFLCFVLLMCTGTQNPAGKMLAIVGLVLAIAAGCACVLGSIALMATHRPMLACVVGATPFAMVVGFFALMSVVN